MCSSSSAWKRWSGAAQCRLSRLCADSHCSETSHDDAFRDKLLLVAEACVAKESAAVCGADDRWPGLDVGRRAGSDGCVPEQLSQGAGECGCRGAQGALWAA